MEEIIVLTVATSVQGYMATYMEQLQKAGIPVYVEDVTGAAWLHRGGYLKERVEAHRRMVNQFRHYRRIVISDAFDVLFFGDRDSLIEKIPLDHVLHAAEKNCYPDQSIAEKIPNRGPWRFFNGGLSAGAPDAFLSLFNHLSALPNAEANILDQEIYNQRLAERDPEIVIDWETQLFFCLYGGYEELGFIRGKPHNTLYGTSPLFVHANGKWPCGDVLKMYEESLRD